MESGILITGKQGRFYDELVLAFLNRGYPVSASRDPEDEPMEVPDSIGDQFTSVPWSRRSLLSARTLVLDAMRAGAPPKHAVVVCSPEGMNAPFHQTESAVLEQAVDAAVKGYLFIVKELVATFLRRGGGQITVVLYDGGAELFPPFDAALMGTVRALVHSLIAFYERESVGIRGLEASDPDEKSVAGWVCDSVLEKGDKTIARVTRYAQRSGLFGRGK